MNRNPSIVLISTMVLMLALVPSNRCQTAVEAPPGPAGVIEFCLASYEPVSAWEKREYKPVGIVYVDPFTRISPVHLQNAEAERLADVIPEGELIRVNILLSKDSAEKLAAITGKHRNELLALSINGKVLSVARIIMPITDGRFVINCTCSYKEATEMAAQLMAASK